MEPGLLIVLLAVASAVSMLLLARYAPRSAPAGLTASLSGHTPAGHAWTLDPDYAQPGVIKWIWRVALSTEPFAAWRGPRLTWDQAAFRASGRMSDPPDPHQPYQGWTVGGEAIPPEVLGALVGAAPAISALGFDTSGWVYAELPASEAPDTLVAFGSRIADALSPPRELESS